MTLYWESDFTKNCFDFLLCQKLLDIQRYQLDNYKYFLNSTMANPTLLWRTLNVRELNPIKHSCAEHYQNFSDQIKVCHSMIKNSQEQALFLFNFCIFYFSLCNLAHLLLSKKSKKIEFRLKYWLKSWFLAILYIP